MGEIIYFDCLPYSYQLIETSCSSIILVGSKKSVTARRRAMIKNGMDQSKLIIRKTTKEQKCQYMATKNVGVFLTLEGWN